MWVCSCVDARFDTSLPGLGITRWWKVGRECSEGKTERDGWKGRLDGKIRKGRLSGVGEGRLEGKVEWEGWKGTIRWEGWKGILG